LFVLGKVHGPFDHVKSVLPLLWLKRAHEPVNSLLHIFRTHNVIPIKD